MSADVNPIPYVFDPDFTLYVGDVLDVLAVLPDESIDCVVTSPPYWGLRDYGEPGQLGLEPTPDEYVANMVSVFREVRRVIAKHGTCWLNLGDSYSGSNGSGLKPKDLVGIPWRVAFALQADGWYLRADVIWSKPNPMPESVTDRPTKAHEQVFLLTRSARYFYDADAVREPQTIDRAVTKVVGKAGSLQHRDGERWPNPAGRNIRSVWTIATQPFPGAHFATFPEQLVRRCIDAGCPAQVCRVCGKPRERIVEVEHGPDRVSDWAQRAANGAKTGGVGKNFRDSSRHLSGFGDCGHGSYWPGRVLDPFIGSGTTALVARKLNRHSIGIELNSDYADICALRLSQLSLLAEAT